MTSAEPVAQAAADLLTGAVRVYEHPGAAVRFHASDGRVVSYSETLAAVLRVAQQIGAADGVDVIDATAVYDSLGSEPVDIYQQAVCVAPPFQAAIVGYTNRAGNAILLATQSAEMTPDLLASWSSVADSGQQVPWSSVNPVDWGRVRWMIKATVLLGGRTRAGAVIPTLGPLADLWAAVYDDGALADLHWVDYTFRLHPSADGRPVGDPNDETAAAAGALITDATTLWVSLLSFLNCRNVEAAEPARPRSERRRLARIMPGGRVVKVLTVTTPGGKRSAAARHGDAAGQALTTVRGHFGHYGNCCPGRHEPNGLLFGRYEGRYWRPQTARGSRDHGEVVKAYRPDPTA